MHKENDGYSRGAGTKESSLVPQDRSLGLLGKRGRRGRLVISLNHGEVHHKVGRREATAGDLGEKTLNEVSLLPGAKDEGI